MLVHCRHVRGWVPPRSASLYPLYKHLQLVFVSQMPWHGGTVGRALELKWRSYGTTANCVSLSLFPFWVLLLIVLCVGLKHFEWPQIVPTFKLRSSLTLNSKFKGWGKSWNWFNEEIDRKKKAVWIRTQVLWWRLDGRPLKQPPLPCYLWLFFFLSSKIIWVLKAC